MTLCFLPIIYITKSQNVLSWDPQGSSSPAPALHMTTLCSEYATTTSLIIPSSFSHSPLITSDTTLEGPDVHHLLGPTYESRLLLPVLRPLWGIIKIKGDILPLLKSMGTLPLTLLRPGPTSALRAPAPSSTQFHTSFSFTILENNPQVLSEDTFNLFYSIRRHSYW